MSIFYVNAFPVDSKNTVPEVGLWYPGQPGSATHLEIVLMDVRAADNIRISYDFVRDGWTIEQASVFEWDGDDMYCDRGWTLVAFVKAWQLDKRVKTINLRNGLLSAGWCE